MSGALIDVPDVATLLASIRQREGLSYEQMAAKAGTSKTYLLQLNKGKKNPTVGWLVRVCGALGYTLHVEARKA